MRFLTSHTRHGASSPRREWPLASSVLEKRCASKPTPLRVKGAGSKPRNLILNLAKRECQGPAIVVFPLRIRLRNERSGVSSSLLVDVLKLCLLLKQRLECARDVLGRLLPDPLGPQNIRQALLDDDHRARLGRGRAALEARHLLCRRRGSREELGRAASQRALDRRLRAASVARRRRDALGQRVVLRQQRYQGFMGRQKGRGRVGVLGRRLETRQVGLEGREEEGDLGLERAQRGVQARKGRYARPVGDLLFPPTISIEDWEMGPRGGNSRHGGPALAAHAHALDLHLLRLLG